MNTRRQFWAALLGLFIAGVGTLSRSFAEQADSPDPLGLADLPGYRAALVGEGSAEGASAANLSKRVSFQDLSTRPDRYRGRRVTVQGRIVRIFRQGSLGSFPPLAEIWIASTGSDLACLVSPQDRGAIPELGKSIRFTGTFLKLVRYAAKGGSHLAPLVVGDQPPVLVPKSAEGPRFGPLDRRSTASTRNARLRERWEWSLSSWALGLSLAALAAGVIVCQHLRVLPRRSAVRRAGWARSSPVVRDALLEFIEPAPSDSNSPMSTARDS
jgi:hypothetical protein